MLPDPPTRAEPDCQEPGYQMTEIPEAGPQVRHHPFDEQHTFLHDQVSQGAEWQEGLMPRVDVVSCGQHPLRKEGSYSGRSSYGESSHKESFPRRKIWALLICLICGVGFLQLQLLRVYASSPGMFMGTAHEQVNQATGQPVSYEAQQYSSAQVAAARKLGQIETAADTARHDFDQFLSHHIVANGVTSQESGSFALWSQGRFAVSDTTGSQVLFEVDPKRNTTGIFGPVIIKGELTLRGALTSESLTATNEITAPAFSTGAFSANQEGEVQAQTLSVDGATRTDSLDAASVHVAGDIDSGGTIKARKLVIEDLVVGGQHVGKELIRGARSIQSDRGSRSESRRGEDVLSPVHACESEGSFQGRITGVGMLTFISPTQGGDYVQKLRVPCGDKTAAVFTSVQDQNTRNTAVVGIEETEGGFFVVCRFPEKYDVSSNLSIVYLAIGN